MRRIEYSKLSKKEKRKEDAKKRRDWNGVNPVTKTVRSIKEYRRNEERRTVERIARNYF